MDTYHIPQRYVGQINMVGMCFCYGLALNGKTLIYLNVAGSATTVEAVWAKLAQHKSNLSILLEKSRKVLALEPEPEGKYTRFQRRLGALRADHLILLHSSITTPDYAGGPQNKTYFFNLFPEQARAKIAEHVTQLVEIAVFEPWHAYLEKAGRKQRLIRRCACLGGVVMERLDLDRSAWTRAITDGLASGEITLPN